MRTLNIPTVGQTFRLLGREYEVMIVEPYSDWVWYVEAKCKVGEDIEVARFYIPSNELTN